VERHGKNWKNRRLSQLHVERGKIERGTAKVLNRERERKFWENDLHIYTLTKKEEHHK
jgi:hypothetical protein